MKSDLVYLKRILEFISKIEICLERGVDDEIIMDSAILDLIQIGECSKKISDDFKSKHSNIYWNDIIGLRNRIAHDCFGINLNRVKSILEGEIPFLKSDINKIN